MFVYKTGDILKEDAQALVNTVNCVGIMGRGIALQFKNYFPENYKAYKAACKQEDIQPGKMFVFEINKLTNPQYIINFPTKRHWKGKSHVEDIKSGLQALAHEIRTRGISSIAIPPLGSGLGGLQWDEVRPLIEDALKDFDNLNVIIYEPRGAPQTDIMVHSKNIPVMTQGRASLVFLIKRYLTGLMDPFVTLLELHKLMYFMQESGQPLRLQYVKATYGPYAENLRHVLHQVEGHFIYGYADGGDTPDKPVNLVPGAIEDAVAFLDNCPEVRERIERVSDLVEGFETPFGLELLATVHWLVKKEKATELKDIISKIYNWNMHKKKFSERQICIAYKVLKEKNWIGSVDCLSGHQEE